MLTMERATTWATPAPSQARRSCELMKGTSRPVTKNAARPAFEIPVQVLHREVDGQMVLLHLESESYFGLDEVGARMIVRLTELPFDEALAALANDYDVSPDILLRDVHDLVGKLEEAGLLERVKNAG